MSNPSEMFSGFPLAFDQGIAKECGVNAAIILNHIIYWLKSNEKELAKRPECFQEGKIWMYETQKEMAEFFEFFSEKEVRDYLKILVDKGLLIKGNFNKNHFEKKNWYSLPDDVFQKVFSKRQIRRIDTDLAVASEATNSSHVYKDKDKEEDKKIQIPAAEPVVVSSQLSALKIPETLKIKLSKEHDDAYLELLEKRCLRWKSRNDDVAAIRYIQSNWDDWNDIVPGDEQRELNIEYLNSLRHLDLKIIAHNRIDVGATYIEFSTNMKVDSFDISSKTFIAEVKEHIEKLKKIDKK